MNKDEMIKEIEKEQPIAMMIQRYLDNNNIKVSNPLLPMHIEEMLNRKNYLKVGEDEIVIKKCEYEKKLNEYYEQGRASAFGDIEEQKDVRVLTKEEFYNLKPTLIYDSEAIDKAKQETAREILLVLKDNIVNRIGSKYAVIDLTDIAQLAKEKGIELED